jgi:hypothetical protein
MAASRVEAVVAWLRRFIVPAGILKDFFVTHLIHVLSVIWCLIILLFGQLVNAHAYSATCFLESWNIQSSLIDGLYCSFLWSLGVVCYIALYGVKNKYFIMQQKYI